MGLGEKNEEKRKKGEGKRKTEKGRGKELTELNMFKTKITTV